MKIIKVKSCKDCPHLGSTGDHCNKNLSRRILSTECPIPGWCPLEDVCILIEEEAKLQAGLHPSKTEAIRWHTTAQDKVIENLRAENEMLRNNGAKLWNGVTDFLDDSSIRKMELLYKNELSRFI